MAITTTAAMLGAAALTAGGTAYASSRASRSQNRAADRAADTSVATNRENNALQREVYQQNTAIHQPFLQTGYAATNALNGMLGLPTFNAPQPGPSAPGVVPPGTVPPSAPPSGALSGFDPQRPLSGRFAGLRGGEDLYRSPMNTENTFSAPEMAEVGEAVQGHPTAQPAVPVDAAQTSALAPASAGGYNPPAAFQNFMKGTNYQWRLDQGRDVLESGAAARGRMFSGATDKALVDYGQNFASNELANYMDLLARQQAVGGSAAGAIAGVGNAYAGNVAAGNLAAGNAQANAALIRGQSGANMWGQVGQSIGQIGGALMQYGMGGAQQQIHQAPHTPGYGGNIVTLPGGYSRTF